MSVELYNQHAAISELQQTEDEIIDRLNLMYDFNIKFTQELSELCKMTNNVEYDQDGESFFLFIISILYLYFILKNVQKLIYFFNYPAFCKRGKELFKELSKYAQPCAELLTEFEAKLEKEEMISHKIIPGKR